MADIDQLGSFYLGRPHDLKTRQDGLRAAALRQQGPHHARRLRRHDRQRQDGPLPVAAGRGRPRRHPGDRDRSQGRPRQPAADVSESARPSDFRPWIDESEAARKKMSPDEFAAQTGRAVARRPGQVGRRRPSASAASATRSTASIYTPGCSAGMPLTVLEVVRRAAAASSWPTPMRSASGSRRPRRACWRCWASTPIRSAAASTSCSRTLLDTAWRAGKDLDLRAADPRHPTAAVRQRSASSISKRSIPAKIATSWR